MSGIDDRIVSIKFDNSGFERKIAETIASLDKLRDSLDFSGALSSFAAMNAAADNVNLAGVGASLDQVNAAANNVNMSHLSTAIDSINSKFSAMGAIAFTAIQHVTSSFLSIPGKLASLAVTDILDPIIGGGKRRAQNIEQAKFMFDGLGLNVESAMASARTAVLGTAFGLDEAAKAAAQFGASGIKVGAQMTGALRGVAGAAAMTGKGFSEIADIFAGSAGSGFVNNMDLMQFSTRGLNAAAAIAPILHTTEANIHEMARNGELDFATFADAMDKAFGKHATEANKTYSGSLANLHAAMSRLGATFQTPILTQQRDLFNALGPVIDNVSTALQPLIQAFVEIRRVSIDHLIAMINKFNPGGIFEIAKQSADTLHAAFDGLTQIFGAVAAGWKTVFPTASFSILYRISNGLRVLSHFLILGSERLDMVRRIFAGFFAILDIGVAIIKDVVIALGDVFNSLTPATTAGSGGMLSFAATIGDAFVALDKFLVKSGFLSSFFKGISAVIDPPLLALAKLTGALFNLVFGLFDVNTTGGKSNGILKSMGDVAAVAGRAITRAFAWLTKEINKFTDSVNNASVPLHDFATNVANVLMRPFGKTSPIRNELDRIEHREGQVTQGMRNFGDFINLVLHGIGVAFEKVAFYTKGIRDKVVALWGPQDFKPALDAINTGFFAVLLVMLYSLFKPGLLMKFRKLFHVGIFGNLEQGLLDFFKSFKSVFQAIKKRVQVDTLMQIAKAVALIAVSIIALGTMDSGALSRSVAAIGTVMGSLVLALRFLDKGIGNSTTAKIQNSATAKLIGIGFVLKGMASAILRIAAAIYVLGKLDPQQLARGLAAVVAGMVLLVGTILLLSKQKILTGPKVLALKQVGRAMMLMATSLIILALAIKIMSLMSWKTFGEGLTRIALGLGVLVIALNLMPENAHIMAASISLGILAFSLGLFALTIFEYSKIPWKILIRGTLSAAFAIGALGLAMRAMPEKGKLITGALAIFILSFALQRMAKSVEVLGKLKFGDLAKAIGGLAIVLALLVVAVGAFGNGEMALGAGVMLLVVGALWALTKVLEALGNLSIAQLVVGILALAAALIVVSVVTAALSELAPGILVLGIALLYVAGAVAVFGGGILLLAWGLKILSESGVKGAEALVKVVDSIVLVAIALVDAVGNIVNALVDQLIQLTPKLAELAVGFIFAVMGSILLHLPDLINAGVEMFINLVNGFMQYRDKFADALIMLIYGLADTIHKKSGQVWMAIGTLALAFLDAFLGNILDHAPLGVGNFFKGLFGNFSDTASSALQSMSPSKLFEGIGHDLSAGLNNGIDKPGSEKIANDWALGIVGSFKNGLGKMPSMPELNGIQPTITPVMDMSNVTSSMNDMNKMFADSNPTFAPNSSTNQADQLSYDSQGNQTTSTNQAPSSTTYNYEQNNYSPKALSTNDIYRNTNSQIVLKKKDMGVPS